MAADIRREQMTAGSQRPVTSEGRSIKRRGNGAPYACAAEQWATRVEHEVVDLPDWRSVVALICRLGGRASRAPSRGYRARWIEHAAVAVERHAVPGAVLDASY